MRLTVSGFGHNERIPDEYAFGTPHPVDHVQFSDNRNPALSWTDVPERAKSLIIVCVDSDVPTKPDDVNQVGRMVPASLPRGSFYHWVMVDIPTTVTGIEAGFCSDGITKRGKTEPPGPAGSRQGINDYTSWFAGDPDMEGTYYGYDGPCPPWNDSIMHHYHFILYASDMERCPVEGDFTGKEVEDSLKGHVVDQVSVTGVYTLNQSLRNQ